MPDAMTEQWDFLGNTWAVDMLREQIRRKALHHAYLITGPTGIGRRTLALRFAQALNCRQTITPGVPCGICPDCKQILSINHADVRLIEGTRGGRGKDEDETESPERDDDEAREPEALVDPLGNPLAGFTLRVNQIRGIVPFLNLKPYSGNYRVAILLRFHEATNSASNALLKTLEEAPPSSILIITADSVDALLPTIVSRCEVLGLQPLPVDEVAAFLRSRGAGEESAQLAAHFSGGRPGFAARLLETEGALDYRTAKLDDLRSLLPATRAERFGYAAKLSQDKSLMRSAMQVWLSFWRDVMWNAGGAQTPLANIDRREEIEGLAGHVGLAGARRLVSDLDDALDQLDANVNPRLLLEVLLLDWPR